MLLYQWLNIFRGGVYGPKKKKERKKERKAKTMTRTINGMTISGAFFLSCFT